jgi:hypothetical protein
MGRTLETLGFRPVFAASCAEALIEIDRQPFALAVVADPIEGHTAADIVQALQRHGIFRIIMLAESEDAAMATPEGPAVVMDMPFSMDSVVSAIRALVPQGPLAD